VRYVWRHTPLNDVHQYAQLAAEAAEAAAAQGAFWEMYDTLLSHQGELRREDVARYAGELGLDADRVMEELRRRVHAPRVSEDVASADESGVSGTPTLSSTDAATTAPTTSPRSATRSGPPEAARARRPGPDPRY